MPVYINDIATVVPTTFGDQQTVREIMKESVPGDRKTRSIIHRIYTQSGIEKRHATNYDLQSGEDDGFFQRVFKNEKPPSTGERNAIYERESKALFTSVGKQLWSEILNLKRKKLRM